MIVNMIFWYLFIIIQKNQKNKGSAIFIHLTDNYKKTEGCVAKRKRHVNFIKIN